MSLASVVDATPLQSTLSDRVTGVSRIASYLSVLPRVQTTYEPEIFRVLVAAVRQSRQVSMVYWTAGRDETQRRTVD